MGRAPRDDRAEGLSPAAEVAAAQARFDDEVRQLARAQPHEAGFAAGFVAARQRLEAPVQRAEERAASHGGPSARAWRRAVDHQLFEAMGRKPLLVLLERDDPASLHTRPLRRDFEDAGAGLSEATRTGLAALDTELLERTAAFEQHTRTGPERARVRATLRDDPDEGAREAAWASVHHHGAAAAGLCRDILSLRRARARALGYAHYAAWAARDMALARQAPQWLDAMATATRKLPPPRRPWDAHRVPPRTSLELSRDATTDHLRSLLAERGLDVRFDVSPRAEKHPGAWVGSALGVTVYASLPTRIGREGLRTLLHETGHAIEAAVAPANTRAPADLVECPSTMLEPFAWHGPTLHALGHTGHGGARPMDRRVGSLALAIVDQALHADYDPSRDGSPLPWARRVLEAVRGCPRDPRDASVATIRHLFAHPHGYAARYLAYPIGDALALQRWTRAPRDLQATLDAMTRTWSGEHARRDPAAAIAGLTGAPPSADAFVDACVAVPSHEP